MSLLEGEDLLLVPMNAKNGWAQSVLCGKIMIDDMNHNYTGLKGLLACITYEDSQHCSLFVF